MKHTCIFRACWLISGHELQFYFKKKLKKVGTHQLSIKATNGNLPIRLCDLYFINVSDCITAVY